MVYHRIFIDTGNSEDTYNKLTSLLGVTPTVFEKTKFSVSTYDTWSYCADIADEEPYFDFINNFLDILEPKFNKLADLGVEKNAITFWYLYEYDQQCSMEFHPQEMKRLGESGITLCIDCWAKSTEESTTA